MVLANIAGLSLSGTENDTESAITTYRQMSGSVLSSQSRVIMEPVPMDAVTLAGAAGRPVSVGVVWFVTVGLLTSSDDSVPVTLSVWTSKSYGVLVGSPVTRAVAPAVRS